MLWQKGRWCDNGHVKHKGMWGMMAILRIKEVAMLRHKGWWWDNGHVMA